MDMITGQESPAEIIALAYHMEAGLGQFYKAAGTEATDRQASRAAAGAADRKRTGNRQAAIATATADRLRDDSR